MAFTPPSPEVTSTGARLAPPRASESPRDNPFRTAGTLPAGHGTYVVRTCDAALAAALQNKPLIAVEGDFSTGKSSLALKARADIGATHEVCYVDLQDFRTDEESVFMREFFEQLSMDLDRKVDSWKLLDEDGERPLALFIDELGVLSSAAAPSFVAKIVKFATTHPDRARVIVCLPSRSRDDSIKRFLKDLGVENSKYLRDWHRIRMPLLDRAGLHHLIELLPPRARGLAHEHADVMTKLSGGYPMRVQRVCSALWEAETENAPSSDLKAILGAQGSYEE